MKVGFTGTREGMSEAQRSALRLWLKANRPVQVHHGNCVGADEQFSAAVVDASEKAGPFPYEVAHPCNIPSMQDQNDWADEHRQILPPLERNRNIVDSVDVLLAGPKGPEEQRSGTWSTIRYARKLGKRVVIFWPDGTTTES